MKFYFYGDSNTYGYDPRGACGGRYPAESRWTDILSDALGPDISVAADGLNGRTIPDVRHGLEYLRKRLKDEAPVFLFAVMLGTNDILNSLGQDSGKIIERMEAFCAEVSRTDDKMKILIISPPPIRIPGEEVAAYQRCLGEVAEGYRGTARKYGYSFVDAALWSLDMAFDGVHLSEEGHREFARKMADELKKSVY